MVFQSLLTLEKSVIIQIKIFIVLLELLFKLATFSYLTVPDSITLENRFNRVYTNYEKDLGPSKAVIFSYIDLSKRAKSKFFEAKGYHILGKIYLREANYDSASFCLFKSLKIREEKGYRLHAATCYESLAELYFAQNSDSIAISYLYKSLKIKQSDGNLEYLKSLYNTLGNAHSRLGSLDSARFYYELANEQAIDQKDLHLQAVIYQNLGALNFQEDFNELAIEDFRQSYFRYSELNRISESAVPLFNIGNVYSWMENYDSALYYYQQSIEKIGAGGNYEYLDEVYLELANTYNELEMKDSSIQMFQEYVAYRDSVFSIEKTNAILDAETKYQTKEKEQLLQLEELENDRLAVVNQSHKKTIYILAITISGIGVLVFLLIRNFRRKSQFKKLEIESKNSEIDQLLKEQEAKSYAALLEGQNNERKRIARDIHDKLGGTLATVNLHFQSMDEKIESLKTENKDQFRTVQSLLDSAIKDVRKISHDLTTGKLSELGLKGAIEDLERVLNGSGRINAQFVVIAMPELGLDVERELYAIIQELVSNALKHARANKVELQFLHREGELNISYFDDGIGFVLEESLGKGIGLRGIEERLKKLNGTIEYDAMVGRGTELMINIPV